MKLIHRNDRSQQLPPLMAPLLGRGARTSAGRVRRLVAGLGVGTLLFSVAPVVAPRQFARLFGFPAPDPATASVIRSTGLRDAIMGMGLWSVAAHGGNYAPWLLARTLTDGGDTLSVAMAVARGERNPRFVALGVIALGAALADAALYVAARRAK
jgi:hypothetical protein